MDHNGGGDDQPSESESEGRSGRGFHDVSLSLDAILSLLAHYQRRDVLGYLADRPDQTCSIDECVAHVMKREEDRTGTRPGHDQVATILHHVHVPKLTDAGLLEYDPRSRQLRYGGHDRLETWLDRIQADEAEQA